MEREGDGGAANTCGSVLAALYLGEAVSSHISDLKIGNQQECFCANIQIKTYYAYLYIFYL